MTVARRQFLSGAAALGLFGTLFTPEQLRAIQDAQNEAAQNEAAQEEAELPHSSTGFWGGFYDQVNPNSPDYGKPEATRGAESLASPGLETQYLHYLSDTKELRYATAIEKSELLDHDGDVSVSILMNQFRPSTEDAKDKNASQLRVDTTQNHPFMNLLSPLAWSAMASLKPDKAGQIPPLDQLGFKSDQVMNSSSHILLTQGSGKVAVNISRAARNSGFVKALQVMVEAAKMAAPFVALPAVSVPAMSAFSEAFSYWENRTQFLINGNLVNAAATQQAMDDPELHSPLIGLMAGDYVVVAKKDTDALHAVLPQLRIFQGYLVHADTDLNQPIDQVLADKRIPDITYATVKVGVSPIDTSAPKASPAGSPGSAPSSKEKKKSEKG
jgi:hypothetical protein